MSKLSIKTIFVHYIGTLYDGRSESGELCVRDLLVQIVAPALLGLLSGLIGFRLAGISNLIAGVAIVSALLGAVSVFLFQVRMQLNEKMQQCERDDEMMLGTIFSDDDVSVVDELFYCMLWCILEGMFICTVLIVCDCSGIVQFAEWELLWAFISGLVVMAACNLLLVLLMCLKRMMRVYERFGVHKRNDSL